VHVIQGELYATYMPSVWQYVAARGFIYMLEVDHRRSIVVLPDSGADPRETYAVVCT